MKMFLSQKKYTIIAAVAVIATLYVLFSIVVPVAKRDAETFFMALNRFRMFRRLQIL